MFHFKNSAARFRNTSSVKKYLTTLHQSSVTLCKFALLHKTKVTSKIKDYTYAAADKIAVDWYK